MTDACKARLTLMLSNISAASFRMCLVLNATYETHNCISIQVLQCLLHVVTGQVPDRFCMLCVQDQDAVHKAWLLGHKLLLGLHMASRTALHKAAPSMFGGPSMMGVAMGNSAYRGLTSAMYKDGILFAGGLTVAAALAVRMMY